MYNCSILVKGTLNLHSNSIPLVISISWGKISSQQMANVKTGGKNWSCLPFCGLYLVHENVYYRITSTVRPSKTGMFTSIVFNISVTEWLKDQSPLTEEELQKLCISMDDFKVLNGMCFISLLLPDG